ncbi:hypothetical protein Patl1_04056 [Pistacia atlantica]|uniref:Uncharacterized protein n=1 Tax=Pistacia atlantica TaxID=434234 RepID=A0ACC1BX22_9ROSI|nr:hypothetical protein Patl1_04056 [Pistacia atlantica]
MHESHSRAAINTERDKGFIALGEMVGALDGYESHVSFIVHSTLIYGLGAMNFLSFSVVVYLDDEDKVTRKDAALSCCKLVANSFSGVSCTQFGSSRSNRTGGKRRRLIEELVEKLLIAAVADADVTVRHSIFSSLHGNRGFDEFLAQAESLSAVFAALNDEDFDVREYAISVAGRLSEKNPAYVLPALRRHLIQLLTYLDQR